MNLQTKLAYISQSCSSANYKQNLSAIADSGTTNHFLSASAPVPAKFKIEKPIAVRVANGQQVLSDMKTCLDLSHLTPKTKLACVMPGFLDKLSV